MQGRRSLKPHLESLIDREPRVRRILCSFESPSIMEHPSSSSSEQNETNLAIAQFGQLMNDMMKNQQEQFEHMERRFARLEEIRPRDNHLLRQPMKDYYNPGAYMQRQGIHCPILETNFELKPSFLALLPTFKGLPNEDPYDHIEEFIKICDTISIAGVPQADIRLIAFPYTLKESAHHWCKFLEERIEDWEVLKDRFLRKYFPVGKQNALRNVIETFAQAPNERIHEAWERFKEAILKCPTHGIQKYRLIQYFYIGLVY